MLSHDTATTGLYPLSPRDARRIYETGGRVEAVLLGENLGDSAGDLIAFGADRVHIGDGAASTAYLAEAWMPKLIEVAADAPPAVI
mgnify:CR=1 FL=1